MDMTLAGIKPRDIMNALKRRNKENASTMKTIYNAKADLRTYEMEGRSAMQQLMKVLVEKYYVYWYRNNETTDEVLDLFWAHPESILLVHQLLGRSPLHIAFCIENWKIITNGPFQS